LQSILHVPVAIGTGKNNYSEFHSKSLAVKVLSQNKKTVKF